MAYNYVPILMTASLLHAVSALYGSIYFAHKNTKAVAWTSGISAIANVAINVCLIKQIGLYAASLSTFFAYALAIVIRQIDIQKIEHISINKRYLVTEVIVYCLVFLNYYYRNVTINVSVK